MTASFVGHVGQAGTVVVLAPLVKLAPLVDRFLFFEGVVL